MLVICAAKIEVCTSVITTSAKTVSRNIQKKSRCNCTMLADLSWWSWCRSCSMPCCCSVQRKVADATFSCVVSLVWMMLPTSLVLPSSGPSYPDCFKRLFHWDMFLKLAAVVHHSANGISLLDNLSVKSCALRLLQGSN